MSTSTTQTPGSDPVSPAEALRVESGTPSPEELAALVAVLAAVGGPEETGSHRGPSAWADPSWRLVGASPHRGGWAAGALPR